METSYKTTADSHCRNCEVSLAPEHDFCPKCSQKTGLHRLSLHDIIHDAIHFFFHADKSLLNLVRELAVNNGKVAREFIAGKRKKYFPPLNFFLLVAAVYLFVQIQTDYPHINVVKAYPELLQIQNKALQVKMINAYQRREDAIHFMNHHSNTVMMLSLPVIALVFWLLYRRKGFNYTEHLVGGMYMFGFFTLIFTVLSYFANFIGVDGRVTYLLYWIGQIAYFSIFYRKFMQSSKTKAFFSSLLAVVVLFAISFLAVGIYMFMK